MLYLKIDGEDLSQKYYVKSLANKGNNRSLWITQGRLGVSVFHISQSHLCRAEILILWCVQELWRYSIVSRPTLPVNTNRSNYCSTRIEWFIQSNTLLRSKIRPKGDFSDQVKETKRRSNETMHPVLMLSIEPVIRMLFNVMNGVKLNIFSITYENSDKMDISLTFSTQ